jgi:hypothetical protein
MKIIAFLIEVFSWLKIVASPLLISVIIAGVIYLYLPGNLGLLLSASILLIGLILGIIWATRVWKKQGTTNYLARIYATPELDKINDEEKK